MQTQFVAITKIEEDPNQPRKIFDQDEIVALGRNIQSVGQLVPIICYQREGTMILCDGARRLRAARLVGLETLSAVVLPQMPDEKHLRLAQMSIEAHKVSLTPWERSCFLAAIKEENGCTVTELAAALDMKQSVVTKLLSYQRLAKPLQDALHRGKLDTEKAFIIGQEPHHDRQCEIARAYLHLPREQLRRRIKADTTAEPKHKRARFSLPEGITVTMHGRGVTLSGAIDAFLMVVRGLKRAKAKNLDLGAAQKLMRDKATHVLAKEEGSSA